MNCPIRSQNNLDWLLDYCAGRLDRDRAALVERHVETCADCARFVESQATVWHALDQWEPEAVSRDFDRRLYRRIDQAQPSNWLGRIFRPLQPLWRPVVPVTAACLLILASVVLHSPHASVTLSDTQARIEKAEAEQVERTLDDMQMLQEMTPAPQQEGQSTKSM